MSQDKPVLSREQIEDHRAFLNGRGYYTMDAGSYNQLCDLALSALDRQGWISVEERLPDLGVDVLIYHVLGDRDRPEVPHAYDVAARLLEGGWYFPWDRGDKQRPMFVTHWRPLSPPHASGPASGSPDGEKKDGYWCAFCDRTTPHDHY